MPFKVVQTSERGKKFLSCVPHEWEKDECLYWPKNKAEKLSKKENSRPGDDWISIPCEVKRSNLTYDEAQLQINIMSEKTDTEEEMPSNKRPKVQNQIGDFNEMAKKCMLNLTDKVQAKESFVVARHTDSGSVQKSVPATVATKSDPLEDVAPAPVVPHIYSEPDGTATTAPRQDPLLAVQADQPTLAPEVASDIQNPTCDNYYILQDETAEYTFSQKLDNLTAAVAEVKETNAQILFGIAGISTQLDEYLKRSKMDQLRDQLRFEPIDSLKSLEKLENDLKYGDAGGELKRRLSVVCGRGRGRGKNNCFALVDVMFDREFLTKCSWAGGSRNKENKICFKAFTDIIQLFFSIIYDSDNSFTILECKQFFKDILRNATRRNSAQQLRTSTTKSRKSKPGKKTSHETPGPSDHLNL